MGTLPTQPLLTPSAPSSPIPVDLCPAVPKEAALGLFPILVLILVPAGQQASCGKAAVRPPATAPRGHLDRKWGRWGTRRDGGPGKPLPFPGLGPGFSRVRKGQKRGQEGPPAQGSLCPQQPHSPYQPEGCRRRTSVQSAGGRAGAPSPPAGWWRCTCPAGRRAR